MKRIIIEEQKDKLVLGTQEHDGYFYLNYQNGKADTSRLDENSCYKTFNCSSKELCEYLRRKGY